MANRWLPFLAPAPTVSSRPRSDTSSAAFTVEVDERRVEVKVRRNARARRYTLRLSARGDAATVTIPGRGNLGEARAFVDRHLEWLRDKLAPAEAHPALSPGAIVPVRGVPHRVEAAGSTRGLVRAALGVDGHPVLLVPGSPAHAARRVGDHLRAIARADLAEAVARHAASLGVRPKAIRLKDTTSRWGSASTSGTLSFSWRLAMAPPFVLDYLAAHEVAHLKEMNHSSRFWAICHRLAPRTDEAQAWLKANGRELHRLV
ncbi:MAG TPA: M48 family metallopeptidase [Methylomirabilota bacterium]|nr:M48 family metallopeptidase [Methylomirabilota bacterium]